MNVKFHGFERARFQFCSIFSTQPPSGIQTVSLLYRRRRRGISQYLTLCPQPRFKAPFPCPACPFFPVYSQSLRPIPAWLLPSHRLLFPRECIPGSSVSTLRYCLVRWKRLLSPFTAMHDTRQYVAVNRASFARLMLFNVEYT